MTSSWLCKAVDQRRSFCGDADGAHAARRFRHDAEALRCKSFRAASALEVRTRLQTDFATAELVGGLVGDIRTLATSATLQIESPGWRRRSRISGGTYDPLEADRGGGGQTKVFAQSTLKSTPQRIRTSNLRFRSSRDLSYHLEDVHKDPCFSGVFAFTWLGGNFAQSRFSLISGGISGGNLGWTPSNFKPSVKGLKCTRMPHLTRFSTCISNCSRRSGTTVNSVSPGQAGHTSAR